MVAPVDKVQVEFSSSVGYGRLAMRAGKRSEMDQFAAFKQIDSVLGKSAPVISWMQVFDDRGMRVVVIDAKGVAVATFVLVDQCQPFFGRFRAGVAMPFDGWLQADGLPVQNGFPGDCDRFRNWSVVVAQLDIDVGGT